MNSVSIRTQFGVNSAGVLPRLRRDAQRILKLLGKDNWELSVYLCNDEEIRKLNREHRSKDAATDVLSFALGENYCDNKGHNCYIAGDIVISLETLARSSELWNVSAQEEIVRLLIHGVLHLDGMDHKSTIKDSATVINEPMLKLQEELLRTIMRRRRTVIES